MKLGKPPVILPLEWKFASKITTISIVVCILMVFIFFISSWKIGVCALFCVFMINCIVILINRYKYGKLAKEFETNVRSGFTPCLIYVKSDFFQLEYELVVDDKLSVFLADLNANTKFNPKIVFLSNELKTEFTEKCFCSDTEVEKFYKTHIEQLPCCELTDKNLAVIRDVLKYRHL